MSNAVDRILNPRTVAVVGASNDPEKRGYRAIKTLLADEYQGEIIPMVIAEVEPIGRLYFRWIRR